MNALAPLTMDRDTFLAWVEGFEGRAEFVEGKAIMMAPLSRGHGRLVRNLVRALEAVLDPLRFEVLSESVGVSLPASVRQPDVVVEPVNADLRSRFTENPVFLAEILSPFSTRTDLIEKPAEYAAIASLADYLVLSQDEPIVWLFTRDAEGRFPIKPAEITGRDETVTLRGVSVTLSLADLYRGIGDAP